MSDEITRAVRTLCDMHAVPESSTEAEDADAYARFLLKKGYTMQQMLAKVDIRLQRTGKRAFHQWDHSLQREDT